VFSDATAGSATVPDGFNGIPLSYQAFRPSSSDGFLRLPMTWNCAGKAIRSSCASPTYRHSTLLVVDNGG